MMGWGGIAGPAAADGRSSFQKPERQPVAPLLLKGGFSLFQRVDVAEGWSHSVSVRPAGRKRFRASATPAYRRLFLNTAPARGD